jgi:Family of unknown function (DUF5989)
MDFLRELTRFLIRRRKFWLTPVILIMVGIGALVAFSQGSVIAPFIYTIF